MLNGFCGIMSIFNSLAFCLSRPSDYTYLWKALGFLPAGLLADFLDGKVARWRGKSSLLGQELDSLADLVRPASPPPAFPIVYLYLVILFSVRFVSKVGRFHLASLRVQLRTLSG